MAYLSSWFITGSSKKLKNERQVRFNKININNVESGWWVNGLIIILIVEAQCTSSCMSGIPWAGLQMRPIRGLADQSKGP